MRARHADARLVVAVDVGAHVELEFVLLGIQQLADLLGIADRVDAARDGAGDRTGLDPRPIGAHEHFGRGRDQKFAVTEVHQRAIGRRIDPAQPLEHFRRRTLAGLGEQLARHRLEQIAARKRRARAFPPSPGIRRARDRQSPAAASWRRRCPASRAAGLRWTCPFQAKS